MKKIERNQNQLNLFYLFLISFLCILFFSASSPFYSINPWSDANIFLTIGRGLKEGKLLYTDLFDHKGPLLYAVYLLAACVSDTSFFGVFLIEILCLFFFLYYSEKLLNLFSDQNHFPFLLLTAVLLTTGKAFSFGGGSAEELALPLFQGCMYLACRVMKNHQSFTWKDTFIIGICAGIAFLSKFTMTGMFLGIGISALIYQIHLNKKNIPSCLLSALGAVILVFFITLIPFLWNHNASDYFNGYFVFNLTGYADKAPVFYRIYQMGRAFFFYLKNNIRLVGCSALGLFTAFIYGLKKNQKWFSSLIFWSFLIWYAVSFVGGRFIAYYILPIVIYLPFVELLSNKLSRRVSIILITVATIISIAFSENIHRIGKTDTVQSEITQVILSEKENPSVLVYHGYDEGFYLKTDTIPACRYFTHINSDIKNFDEDTEKCIAENRIDFLISMNEELHLKNYQLIYTTEGNYDGEIRKYYLYEYEAE